MKKAVPQQESTSPQTKSQACARSKEVRASVEQQLAEGLWFDATTDLWTSPCGGGEPFMSFTVHDISSDWPLKS